MASPMKEFMRVENRMAVVREYSELWKQYFQFFSEDLSEKNITRQEEQEFANIISVLALNQYKFQELAGDHFKDASKVIEVLEKTPTLGHIKNMQEGTFSKIQVDWHTLFIGMHKALGRLLRELSPKQLEALKRSGGVNGQVG